MLSLDPIEVTAALFGIVSIVFSVKRHVAVYPIGLVSVACYTYTCYKYGIYADMWIQVIFGIMSIQGWWAWYFVRHSDNTVTPRELSVKGFCLSLFFGLVLWPVIALLLATYSDSTVIWLDSFTTAFSLIGMWLMVYQYRYHWILWGIVNTISVPLYFYKGLYFSTVFYFLALLLSVYGWFSWRSNISQQT